MATTKPRRRDWLRQHLPGRLRGPSPEPSSQRDATLTAPQTSTTTAAVLPSAAAQTSIASDDSTCADACLSAQLWDRAYDELKKEETTLLERYEKALSHFLQDSSVPETPKPIPNAIIQDNADKRREQMKWLVDAGIKKTEKEARVKEGLNSAMEIALQGKDIISLATQSNPQAALAWAGISVGLELFVNPLQATKKNRDGLLVVIKKMDWYWNLTNALSKGLFDDDNKLSGLRREFENQIVDLYKLLLTYQIKSVCSYYRNRGVAFLRDMVKLEDWDGDLKAILVVEQQYRQRFKDDMMLRQNSALQQFITEHKLEKDQQCLRELCKTDPRDEKSDIEDRKGGLLEDSYSWILENPKFKQWRSSQVSSLLWINADPGKGKTMLLSGIIDELEVSRPAGLLSFFFCQASDSGRNNAAAVLRGLIWLLARQKPSLISYVREKYDYSGRHLFEDEKTSWFALATILKKMTQDTDLETTYLVIDALDECDTDLPRLLDLITKHSSPSSRVKWLVSSRRQPLIEQEFRFIDEQQILKLDTKENEEQISRVIEVYIDRKLCNIKTLEDEDLRHQVQDILLRKAGGTFLWVAHIVQELERPSSWDPLQVVQDMPPGLPELYQLMLARVHELTEKQRAICLSMLSIATLAYRPLRLAEIGSLSRSEGQAPISAKTAGTIVSHCGTFLTVRDGQVNIIHESARDFLSDKMGTADFPTRADTQQTIFTMSLELMTEILSRDMYKLEKPGFPIEKVQIPDPDPLETVRYSCVYWIDHICASDVSKGHERDLQDGGIMHDFLQTRYLYWLEALSLCESMPIGVTSIAKLENLLKGVASAAALTELVHDAYRFIMHNKSAIETSPLQAYVSALVFSPTQSLTRRLFEKEAPNWLTIKPAPAAHWSECLQTLYGHNGEVVSVMFCCNSALLVSSARDDTVKVWNASTGVCLQTFPHPGVISAAFSHDSTQIVSASSSRLFEDDTIKIWNTASGECLETLKIDTGPIDSFALSLDSTWFAFGAADNIEIWTSSGEYLRTLEGHADTIALISISPDSTKLASSPYDETVKIWSASSGECLRTLEGYHDDVVALSFSHDSKQLLSASADDKVRIWSTCSGECIKILGNYMEWPLTASFSPDSSRIVSAPGRKMRIWKTSSGDCVQTLEGHMDDVSSVSFSPDSTQLVSASYDGTIKLWDFSKSTQPQMVERPVESVSPVAFEGHSNEILSLAFSNDAGRLASRAFGDRRVKIWDVRSGECLQTSLDDDIYRSRMEFDATGSYLRCDDFIIDITVPKMSSDSDKVSTGTASLNQQPKILSLDEDCTWIRHKGENLVWLPSEYRATAFAVSGNRVAIGVGSGKIYMFTLEMP